MMTPMSPYILIVDDDDALLRALPEALRLRMDSIRVDTADTARSALERIAATDYDTIISDIKMPGMDGITLLARIHELRPETPTLLITGHGEHDLAIQALRHGAYDFIQKPIDRDYFISSLKRAVQVRQLKRQVEEQRLALEQHAQTLEQTVEERTRELVEASRAKEAFLSIASHELKTPLTTIKALAQMTRRRLEKSGAAEAAFLDSMERAIGRMEMLVNDLLDASRIHQDNLALRLERADLTALVREVANEQAALTVRLVRVDAPDTPIVVEVDTERIWQVMTNLLSNAFKYSPEDQPVDVTLRQRDSEALLVVRDWGDGIPPGQVERIFERFYRVPDAKIWNGSGIGLGLGLYITHDLVERHGGCIWVENDPGGGSAFHISLPLAPHVPSPPSTESATVSQIPSPSEPDVLV